MPFPRPFPKMSQGQEPGTAWDGHGAPGMATYPTGMATHPGRNPLPQDTPGWPCRLRALLWSQRLRLSRRSGIIPDKQPGLGHFRSNQNLGSFGRRRRRGFQGVNPWIVLTVRAECSQPAPGRDGKALEKRLQRLQLNSKHGIFRGWMDGRGRAGSGAYGGRDLPEQTDRAGKPPGSAGDWDVPAGIAPAATRIPGLGAG